jgi:hypothetical protein
VRGGQETVRDVALVRRLIRRVCLVRVVLLVFRFPFLVLVLVVVLIGIVPYKLAGNRIRKTGCAGNLGIWSLHKGERVN